MAAFLANTIQRQLTRTRDEEFDSPTLFDHSAGMQKDKVHTPDMNEQKVFSEGRNFR